MRKKQSKIDVLEKRFKLALFNLFDFVCTKYEGLKSTKKNKLFPFLFFAFFLFAKPSYGATTLDINQNTSGGVSGAQNVWGQSFTAQKNNINQFHLEVSRSAGATVNFDWYICKGVAGTSTFSSTYNCGNSGNTLVASGTVTGYVLQNNNTALQPSFVQKYTQIGAQYYIAVHCLNTYRVAFAGGTNDNYTGGQALPTQLWSSYNDLYFQTWYESTYDPAYVTLTSPTQGQRFVGQPVLFEGFVFNPQLAYNTLKIEILDKETWTSLQDVVGDISSATSSPFSIQVPYEQFSLGNYRAIAYLIDSNTGIKSTSTRVDYMLGANTIFSGTSDAQYQTGTLLTQAQLCTGIDTTSFFGGINCGFRMIVAFAVTPNESTLTNLKTSYVQFKTAFPFSAYFQLTDTISSAISSTTLSRSGTFDVPMIDKQGHIGTIPVLSSSSMPKAIGQSNTDLIRNTVTWFMWLCVAFLVFIQFKKL
jgi:hypothetical protein